MAVRACREKPSSSRVALQMGTGEIKVQVVVLEQNEMTKLPTLNNT
jgi:hypothetical protein